MAMLRPRDQNHFHDDHHQHQRRNSRACRHENTRTNLPTDNYRTPFANVAKGHEDRTPKPLYLPRPILRKGSHAHHGDSTGEKMYDMYA